MSLVAEVNKEEVDLDSAFSSDLASSNENKSPDGKSESTLLPSFSFEDVNPKLEDRRLENRFFDKQSMPNEHFEFNRSASVSQVGTKKCILAPLLSSIS